MKDYKLLRVEIVGEESQLVELARFLKAIDYLGSVGASRELNLGIDGDGAARLRVKFPDLKEEIELGRDFLDKKENLEFYIE